jgi:hypothetical protein
MSEATIGEVKLPNDSLSEQDIAAIEFMRLEGQKFHYILAYHQLYGCPDGDSCQYCKTLNSNTCPYCGHQ